MTDGILSLIPTVVSIGLVSETFKLFESPATALNINYPVQSLQETAPLPAFSELPSLTPVPLFSIATKSIQEII